MGKCTVNISVKDIDSSNVDSIAETMQKRFGNDCMIVVIPSTSPESRSEQFASAMSLVVDARSEIESLKEELEEWKSDIPESGQSYVNAVELEEAIINLEGIVQKLDDVQGDYVSFPNMQ